jgi:2-iminobutanoate/2-iminopropanoate deaminase
VTRAVRTASAPAAIGPYSQAVEAGGWLFLSGQIGLRPDTGELVSGGTAAEAEQALSNLGEVLAAASLTFADVVRVTIYLVDLADFAALNETYRRFVREPYPARSTVGVASLPKGARVEIDAIAVAR